MDWGDLATWSNSFVATGALVAAYMVYRIESRRDREAENERHTRFQVERQSQADKVAGWFAWISREQTADRSFRAGLRYGWAAFVRNASDLPIYDVDIDYYYVVPHAPSGNIPGKRGSVERIPVLPPLDEAHVLADSKMLDQVGREDQANHAVAVSFRDAAGNR
jgi:hypothetical protein